MNSIEIQWPAAPLGEAGWRTRLTDLATKAESLVGQPCSLQQSATLGLDLIGLVWPALSPETVAATARASLLLNTPVLMASPACDQLAEIADRLDQIWMQAQQHPGAGVVVLAPPLLSEVVPGPKPKPQPPTPAADDLPPCWEPVEADSETVSDWFTIADVAELLNLSRSGVQRQRKLGKFGGEGQGWVRSGKSYYIRPEAVERQASKQKKTLAETRGEVEACPIPA